MEAEDDKLLEDKVAEKDKIQIKKYNKTTQLWSRGKLGISKYRLDNNEFTEIITAITNNT